MLFMTSSIILSIVIAAVAEVNKISKVKVILIFEEVTSVNCFIRKLASSHSVTY